MLGELARLGLKYTETQREQEEDLLTEREEL